MWKHLKSLAPPSPESYTGTPSEPINDALGRLPLEPELEEAIDECRGGWSIDSTLARILANLVTRLKPRSILELGAGSSSVLLARALQVMGGGCLTSVEQDPSWCSAQWAIVSEMVGVKAELVRADPVVRLGRMGVYSYYLEAEKEISERAPYDMLLVDAPQAYWGREGAMPLAFQHLARGAVVVLDDASRVGERWAIAKWRRYYPGLRLEYYSDAWKGVAIFRKERDLKPTFDPFYFLLGCYQGYSRWNDRRGQLQIRVKA